MALAAFAASPKGRRVINDVRRRVDTPENREKAMRLKDQAMAKARSRRAPAAAPAQAPAPAAAPTDVQPLATTPSEPA